MKIGFIARADNSGLGTLSWEFARHLKPDRILIVSNGEFKMFPERYKDFNAVTLPPFQSITGKHRDWLFQDIDVLLSIETFYNWELVPLAKQKGIKTALVTMVEMYVEDCLQDGLRPDLFICPSKLDYQYFPEPKVFLPVPVATDRLIWRKREKAEVFIHPASHGGMGLRKGTKLLLEAVKYVKSDIKLIIYTWRNFSSEDPRVLIQKVNFKNYWQIWREGDALVYPQDYNGICLPVVEAFASGMAPISTDIFPFNEYLPKDLLFKPQGFYRTRADEGLLEVEAAKIDPKDIAEKIDEIANKDITKYSLMGKEWAEKNNWEALLPQYVKTLENLCNQEM